MSDRPIIVIDGFNLLIRSFVVMPTMNENGEHNGGLYGSLNSLKGYVKRFRPKKVIIAWDGPGGSKKRRKLYSNYKSNRRVPKRMCRAYDFLTVEEERKSMYFQLDRCKEYLNFLPVSQLKLEYTEADDIIAWAAHYYKDENVVIISTDKDFYQLINSNVKVFNPVTKKIFNEEVIYDKFGIRPKNFVLARALDGDKSDDIEGIKGVGLRTAIKLFPNLNDNETLFPVDIINYAEKNVKESNSSIKYKHIIEEASTVDTNYKIM